MNICIVKVVVGSSVACGQKRKKYYKWEETVQWRWTKWLCCLTSMPMWSIHGHMWAETLILYETVTPIFICEWSINWRLVGQTKLTTDQVDWPVGRNLHTITPTPILNLVVVYLPFQFWFLEMFIRLLIATYVTVLCGLWALFFKFQNAKHHAKHHAEKKNTAVFLFFSIVWTQRQKRKTENMALSEMKSMLHLR